jgi:hypothetical protein
MPSPLFNFLFLVAIIVPMGLYILGVLFLMASLVFRHLREKSRMRGNVPAVAH